MPLHDWTETRRWSTAHQLWISDLYRHLRRALPPGYEAYLGPSSFVALEHPRTSDVSVLAEPDAAGVTNGPTGGTAPEPDAEVLVATLEADLMLGVEQGGRLIAAIELVSRRNKARDATASRFVGYLMSGVHLLLVDLLPRPRGFSFPDAIAASLPLADQPALPTPSAVSYRVRPPIPGEGSYVAVWRRPLAVGQPLPALPLALTDDQFVMVDLEGTYTRAATDAYLT